MSIDKVVLDWAGLVVTVQNLTSQSTKVMPHLSVLRHCWSLAVPL